MTVSYKKNLQKCASSADDSDLVADGKAKVLTGFHLVLEYFNSHFSVESLGMPDIRKITQQ